MRPFSSFRAAAAGLAVTVLALPALAGCGSSNEPAAKVSTPKHTSPYKGLVLPDPVSKPTGTFTDTDGEPFDIAKQTAGHPTLVYFGYTHCPDVCPTTMANLGVAVSKLPKRERKDVRVIFITSDPHRDTPKRMRTWLDSFDKHFIGLTAPWHTIARAAKQLHIGLAKPTPKKGNYPVTHGAEVVAFSPTDNKAHIIYPASRAVKDYKHDLPLLVEGVGPDGSTPTPAPTPKATPVASKGDLRIAAPFLPRPAMKDMAAMYFTVRNTGPTPDHLDRVEVPSLSEHVTTHTVRDDAMVKVDGYRVPAHAKLVLRHGGNHIMLEKLTKMPKVGTSVRARLFFKHAGEVDVTVPVVKRTYEPAGSTHGG